MDSETTSTGSQDRTKHVVVFDIETRRLADQVGGWDALKKGAGGVSAMVVYDNLTERFHLYDGHTLEYGARHLEGADVVLSFNGREFDVPVLEGVLERKLAITSHLDLLQLIWRAIVGRKKGNTLDEVSRRTLGHGKIGKGASAPALADAGRYAELFEYCVSDVDLTRELFAFVQQERGVINSEGNLLPIDVPWWFGDLYLGKPPKGMNSEL